MTKGRAPKRPRKSVGAKRPTYLDHADVDRVMTVLLALVSEVASLRERLDSHEQLGAVGELPSPDAVEDFMPDDDIEQQREAWRDGYISRLFRVLTEDIESLKAQGIDPKA